MRRMHFFYLTVLWSLLLVGGYRQCQWSGSKAELVHPGAILALQRGHQSNLEGIQLANTSYPNLQGAYYTHRVVQLDSLFQLLDTAPSNSAGEVESAWHDSIRVLLHESLEDAYWQALDTFPVRSANWVRIKRYLLLRQADRYVGTKVWGTGCWVSESAVQVSPVENLLLVGDTLHAEIGELLVENKEKIWVNGQPIESSWMGVDSVFTTPGWHTIDVRVVTPLPYGMRHEARRQFKLYVLNPSK